MKLSARVHMRRATLPSVVVIKFGANPPAKEKNRAAQAKPKGRSSQDALVRSCIHSRSRSARTFSRERAAPRRATPVESAREDAPIVGGCASRYRRTRMRDARGAALGASLCEGPASRRAAQLTPLAARSWLKRTPEREGAGGESPTWGADRRQHRRDRDLSRMRAASLISVGCLSYLDGVDRVEDIYLNPTFRICREANCARSEASVFHFRGFKRFRQSWNVLHAQFRTDRM